jgi:nucleotide-binding universal stress UspA family protein
MDELPIRSAGERRAEEQPMFDEVVAGVDDHEGARDVLELANALMSDDGHATLVYVEVLQSKPAPEADARTDAERQRFGVERLTRLRDGAKIDADVARVQAPSVRRGLHEFAVSRAADLLVIGASRRNKVAHVLLGDEVREVLDAPPCAVAVAPISYATSSAGMRRIGVAYDGSEASERALGLARKLATTRHASLSAFEAVPPPVYVGEYRNLEKDAEEEIEQARQSVAALGDLEPRAEYADDPVEALRRFGASVDLLVLGSHRYRGPDRVVNRSTVQRLVDGPPSPLLVDASTGCARSAGADGEISHGG